MEGGISRCIADADGGKPPRSAGVWVDGVLAWEYTGGEALRGQTFSWTDQFREHSNGLEKIL